MQRKQRRTKLNPVTLQEEPYVPLMERLLRLLGSGATVLFFLCLVIALVLGIAVYRAIAMHLFYTMDDQFLQTKALILTSLSAALINLIFILVMNQIYYLVALKLTELECPRTQPEADTSYSWKMALFQLTNYYSASFYIAFLKGRLSGAPDYTSQHSHSYGTRILGQRLEDCDPAGCMVELVIQLFVVMVGRQVFSAFLELAYPSILNFYRKWSLRLPLTHKQKSERLKSRLAAGHITPSTAAASCASDALYEQDYSLAPVSAQFVFDEYLELVVQFGFITLFVAAFPLAPLCALINNIFEIRLDAYKFIVTTRRPIPQQAKGIGIWKPILSLLSSLAVLTNAATIAFTSDSIPKLYYYFTHYSMGGYVEDSLAYFDSSGVVIKNSDYPANTTECRYRDYRQPPCSLQRLHSSSPLFKHCSDKYALRDQFWIILSFRLAFILVFWLLVFSIKAVFAYLLPDTPSQIIVQIQREKYLARQAILQRSRRRDDDEEGVETCGGEAGENFQEAIVDVTHPDGPGLLHPPAPPIHTAHPISISIRSNDNSEVAYQPGQEDMPSAAPNSAPPPPPLPTTTHPSLTRAPVSLRQTELENFRKLYAHRPPPSLSPHPSTVDLSSSSPVGTPSSATPTASKKWSLVHLLPPMALSALKKSGSGSDATKSVPASSPPRPVRRTFLSSEPAGSTVFVQQSANDLEMRQVPGSSSTSRPSTAPTAEQEENGSFHTAEGTPKQQRR